MRLALLLVLIAAAPASAAELMVVGRSDTLLEPRAFAFKDAKVPVAGRRCSVDGRTALSALVRTPLKLGLRDFGACGPRAADGGGLYVRSVAGEAERGSDGWVYKVDNRAPGVGAGDPAGRLDRRTVQVLWFWCRMGASGCQRTLSVAPERDVVAPGGVVRVLVRAHNDEGVAPAAAGARVTMGSASAVTDADGEAVLRAPMQTGTLDVVATQRGRVRSFAATVTVR